MQKMPCIGELLPPHIAFVDMVRKMFIDLYYSLHLDTLDDIIFPREPRRKKSPATFNIQWQLG